MKKINWGYVIAWLAIGCLPLLLLEELSQSPHQDDVRVDDNAVLPIVASKPSPVAGLEEARLRTGERVYVSAANGDFFLVGNLFQATPKGVINLTEVAQRKDRLADLASAPAESFLTFAASDEQAVVTVFTDISCAYCQLFHQEVARLNELGITVRYLAFPREGLTSATAVQMESIWCGSQPHNALGQAFQGLGLPSTFDQNDCGDAVSKGFELGQLMGIRGTPAIVLPNGELGAGHMPAEQLAEAVRVSQIEEPSL